MKKSILAFFIFTLCFYLFTPLANGQCEPDENNIYSFSFGGSDYEIVKEKKTWVDAAACAVEQGGKLAEISTQQEQDSIFFYMNQAGIVADSTVAPDGGDGSYLWIGGNDIAEEGKWIWDGDNNGKGTQFWQGTTTGNVVGGLYNNWGDEPDDWNGQDGLGIAFTNWPLGTAGQWNDVDHTNELYYIIEYLTTNVDEFATEIDKFSFYPNPAKDKIQVSVGSNHVSVSSVAVYSLEGKLMQKVPVQTSNVEVDVSGFSPGTYIISIESGGTKLVPQKLTVIR